MNDYLMPRALNAFNNWLDCPRPTLYTRSSKFEQGLFETKHRLKKVESAGWPHPVVSLKAHIDTYTQISQGMNVRTYIFWENNPDHVTWHRTVIGNQCLKFPRKLQI